mgnify:CR=1 FL=1
MSKQYCFKIINPHQQKYNEEKLENFVKNLYVGEDKFETVEQLPFLVISSENKICILIKGRSKKNLEKIENIHNSKNKSDVKPILVSHKKMNDIKNKIIDLKEIPRIIISKTSVFSHLLHKKPIDINKLVKEINKIFK